MSSDKPQRGKYVLRSTYQKLSEENKKLITDIAILVKKEYMLSFERLEVRKKWLERFKSDELLAKMITEMANEHFKNNNQK